MSVSLVPGYIFIGSQIQFGIDGTNYCGPNYSNGKYGEAPNPDGITTGPVDTLCRTHDLAYSEAKESANPAERRVVADQNLIADMQALMDSGTLSAGTIGDRPRFSLRFNTPSLETFVCRDVRDYRSPMFRCT